LLIFFWFCLSPLILKKTLGLPISHDEFAAVDRFHPIIPTDDFIITRLIFVSIDNRAALISAAAGAGMVRLHGFAAFRT
jgi:hypothetical protein